MRTRLVLAALALLAVASETACWPRTAPAEAAPRVLLLGLDGLDPLILDRLAGAGRLPHLARLMREGAWGPLRSREPLLSPLLWTTIATGRQPQDHGILDFVEPGPDGKAAPITSTRRRVAALWNVASEFGESAGFVGWYASWPAETVRGFVVSDRLGFHQVKSARAEEAATWPAGLAAELRGRFGEARVDLEATRRRFLRDPAASLTPDGGKRLVALARIHATSELYRRILPHLAERFRPRLLGAYFELVDACGHLFMEDAPPRRAGIAEADFAALSETVERCYTYQDEVVGDLLPLTGPDTVTAIVSDHGFKSGEARPRTSGRADTGLAPLWHRLHGVVLLHGKGVLRGARLEGAGLLDVAPTVLALLRVPPSRELPGRPLQGAFAPGTLPASLRPVAAYATPPPRTAPAVADPEAIEKLHALGYIGAPGETLAHDDSSRTAASWLNEGSARAADGDEDGALAAWTRCLELDPRNVSALAFSARARVARGGLREAETLLDRAFAVNPQSAMVRLQRASLALKRGDLAAARDELRAAEALDDNLTGLHLAKARLASAFGDREAALAALARAEALTDADPLLAEIALFRARLLDEAGRRTESEAALAAAAAFALPARIAAARGELALRRQEWPQAVRWLKQAAAQEPGNPTVERQLAQALAGARDVAGAEAAFRRSLAASTTDEDREGAYGDLALLLQGQRREAEVIALLEEATRRLPAAPRLWGLLGAAYGRAGRTDGALSAYERSVELGPTPPACNTLALLHAQRGDRPRALALWQQSLALDPDQPEVRRFLRSRE